jgi:hypothetical protein
VVTEGSPGAELHHWEGASPGRHRVEEQLHDGRGLGVPALLQQPARRLGEAEQEEDQDRWWELGVDVDAIQTPLSIFDMENR